MIEASHRDHHAAQGNGELKGRESDGPNPDSDAPHRLRSELDVLLDRVREDKADPTGKNRNAVVYDCWRMFENMATCYKEEFAERDRYKAQANTWRDKALQLSDIKNALRDALDVVEVCGEWLRSGERIQERDAATACDEVVAYARSLGVRRNCPGNDASCPCHDGDCCHYEGADAWPIPVHAQHMEGNF